MSFILVINSGSSSIKFALVEPNSGDIPLDGMVEKLGSAHAAIQWQLEGQHDERTLGSITYEDAIDALVTAIEDTSLGLDDIVAVGHRVVHGGEAFSESVLIDETVIEAIEACIPLAPLHNKANLLGIEAMGLRFPGKPQVAVFDTAFHQSMPAYAYRYPLPDVCYVEHRVRRYGFHGTSHRYVSQKAADYLNKPKEACDFISAHLGNGCSVAAISAGKSVDTSMGLTPLGGLVMGTRCGDLDPAIVSFLVEQGGYSLAAVMELLNKQSGLLGLSGVGMDMRDISQAAQAGNPRAQLAMDIFCYQLAKYMASYLVALDNVDGLIFTGGIGENSAEIRQKVVKLLKNVGFFLDEKANAGHGREQQGLISDANSHAIFVIATQEEWMIAKDTMTLLTES